MEKEEEVAKIPIEEEVPAIPTLAEEWAPKTSLGIQVMEGKITDIEQIFSQGLKISEPQIVDRLLPNLKSEIIFIGGRTGKGGGIQRIPIKITAKVTKSGRRFSMGAFVVVGNEDGIVGVGGGKAPDARSAILKATQKAKLNLIKVKRGCGSWECSCGKEHSIPFKVEGKSGSVKTLLLPAPKGVGLVADDTLKKILRLAGIKDLWVKTFGNTRMRRNLIVAAYNALKNLYVYER
ncbi:MAG: 30S ribosomal protein S5 [Candidatus Aenigmarchaeota archaeon]|nr:30S ribosomal protein S5 [Candidatus Aenigmarchaeota archaeon]